MFLLHLIQFLKVLKKWGILILYLCGKQTTDGDTAQVGPEMAEYLGIPHIANVIKNSRNKRKINNCRNGYAKYYRSSRS